MHHRRYFTEKGQSLIFVALLLVALLAMLALILDGGYSYYQRRIAQNAADSGALAGASARCRGEDPSAAANAMVIQNDAIMESISYPDEHQVEVVAHIPFNTFFGSIIGQSSMNARAVAAAGCYPPGSGIGVMPVAWSCRGPLGQPVEDECVMQFMQGDECTLEDPMYIIADSTTIDVETLCQDPPNSGQPAGAVDCDLDGNGENDITLLSGGNRSWLDLDGGGGGGAELKDWITGGYIDDIYPHTWVAAQSGVNGSVYDTVHDEILNKDVIMPVFDQFCPDGNPLYNCPGLVHPNAESDEDDVIVGNEPHDYFHLISFAYWRTTCIEAGSHKNCPGRNKLDDILAAAGWSNGNIQSLMTMEGCFKEGFVPGVKGGGGGIPYAGLWTIYLTK